MTKSHTTVPPKQKPMSPSLAPALRLASSSNVAVMSARMRETPALVRAAASSAAGTLAVPPSSDSRSTARALYPSPANRATTALVESTRPRFSWMTSTAPFGDAAAE